MIDWSLEVGLPTHILLNKADKLSRGAGIQQLQQCKRRMQSELVTIQLFSAFRRNGVDEARDVLDHWFDYH